MIFDELTAIRRYKGIHPNLDKAINYFQETDLSQLELGRVDIDGDEVFLLVQENLLNQEPTDVFEYHKSYMDIQMIESGLEIIRYGRQVKEETQTFSGDIGFVTCHKTYDYDLDGRTFAAFFPGEPHQPNQYLAGRQQVRKYVFKVKLA
ncbi:YhcH/YjgK/YiaL family protein [Streptococcus caprae]|uniref:YhcH/YjgK/YiaL family protein n=1 Tax=Streptococcus caprae TaxID=1640501 RepID=A0ABV8CX23_9STRE